MQTKTISILKIYLSDFVSLLYPNLCACCGNTLVKQENVICLNCLVSLPRTGFHLEQYNTVEKLFWGRVNIERGTAFFFYHKGSKYKNLLHNLKYKGEKHIGIELGKQFAAELSGSGFFNGIDFITPVPLHPKKEKARGYNQSQMIAEGMSLICHIPVLNHNLVRTKYTDTQTRKSRFERWQNVDQMFQILQPEEIVHKHILLIDDVVTTGATLEACANAIVHYPSTKVSVATLAYASI